MTNGFTGSLLVIIANSDMSSRRRKCVVYMFAEAELIHHTHNVMKVMYACICMCVCIHAHVLIVVRMHINPGICNFPVTQ